MHFDELIQKTKRELIERGKYLAGFIIFQNGTYVNTTVTMVPNTTYMTQYFTPFNNASWNFGDMAPYAINVLGDYFAQPLGNQIVEGSILINILGIIWVRQDDAGIPLFLLWTLGAVMFGMNLIPAGWQWFIGAVEFIVFGGIAYTLWRGRRNS
jgi:hypothetical protein